MAQIKKWFLGHKHDVWAGLLLAAYVLMVVLAYCRGKNLYGSITDWRTQHVVFPEYFRRLFYENHDLFPDFSFNIGGGQNIYSFSYYGLYNPFVLCSYLFPFLSMRTYLSITSVLCVIAAVWMLYYWCRKRGYDVLLSFFLAFAFANATPVLFHSHRHLMFVNYLPFLILAFLSVDRFLETKKWGRLVLCMTFIILCSFYFSVSAFVALGVYMLYAYFEKRQTFLSKDFLKYLVQAAGMFALGTGMAAFLLLPTGYVLLAGRGEMEGNLFPREFFVPGMNLDSILYHSYSLGMSALFIYAVIHSFIKHKKENAALGMMFVIMTLFSFVPYVLNGMLYANAKVYIPFIPLAILLIGDFASDLFENRMNRNHLMVIALIVVGAGAAWANSAEIDGEAVFGISRQRWYFIDSGLILAGIILYKFCGKRISFMVPALISMIVICAAVNIRDNPVPKKYYEQKMFRQQTEVINSVLGEDSELYRIAAGTEDMGRVNDICNMEYYTSGVYASLYNKNYMEFFNHGICAEISGRTDMMIAPSNGILSNFYMGERYRVVTDENAGSSIGYETVEKKSHVSLLKNQDVLPLAYASDKLLSESTYRRLSFPQKQEALLFYAIVEDDKIPEGQEAEFESRLQGYMPEFSDIRYDNVVIRKTEDGYGIRTKKGGGTITLTLKEPVRDKVLWLQFSADNSKKASGVPSFRERNGGDFSIKINGITNCLSAPCWKYNNENTSFEYYISSAGEIKELIVETDQGYGEVGEPSWYLMDYGDLLQRSSEVDAMEADRKATKKNTVIKGTLKVDEDKICQLSIPYDKGFTVFVDGKETDYMMVDTAFIGFPVTKGKHDIRITFHAPYARAGRAVSLICFLLFLGSCTLITFRHPLMAYTKDGRTDAAGKAPKISVSV